MAASIPVLLMTLLELATKTKLAKISVGTFVALVSTLTAIQLDTVRWFVAEQLNVPNLTMDFLYYIYHNYPSFMGLPIGPLAYQLKNILVNFHWIF